MKTDEIPNGGWQWLQPQTGFQIRGVGLTFDQTVSAIIKHRRANPAIVGKFKLSLSPAAVGVELIKFQQARGAIPPDVVPKQMPPRETPRLLGAALAAVASVKKLASGAALLMDWQTSGQEPVPSEVSSSRAAICAGCPQNETGDLTRYFTAPVAEGIRAKLGKLHEMKLTTPFDSKLGVCKACICELKLKAHTPLDLILKRLKPEVRADLNQKEPRCWILQEEESLSATPPSLPAPSVETTAPDLSEAGWPIYPAPSAT